MTNKPSPSINEFLLPFFPDVDEKICLRTFKPKGAPEGFASPQNHDTTRRELIEQEKSRDILHDLNETCGIYFLVNSGGQRDDDITRYNAFFVECDDIPVEAQHEALNASPLLTSIRVETKKSVHAYWMVEGECSIAEWREIQLRLIAFFHGDDRNKNPSRCMRLPGFDHLTYNGKEVPLSRKKVEVVEFRPERRYTVAEMLDAFPPPEPKPEAVNKSKKPATKQRRGLIPTEFATWEERNAELRRRITTHPTARLNGQGIIDCQGICHNGVGNTALMFNPATGKVYCNNGCDYSAILRAFNLPDGYLPSSNSSNSHDGNNHVGRAVFPKLSEKALFGLAGDFVRTIFPHTEADEAALLLQLLVGFGSVAGRSAYHVADGAKHYPNLFAVIVGKTSAAKGSALAHVRSQLERVDKDWTDNRIQNGLSSGEGLIKAVDDASGVSDKRLLVTETEFSSVLQMHRREGNILSSVIRNLWDGGKAATLTKNNPVSTTNAHVSIIGHITPEELGHSLCKTDIYNGYANRFLFACVKRSKDLPDGGSLSEPDAEGLTGRFKAAVKFAQGVGEMKRDEEASELWRGIYPKLVEERPDAFGKVIARRRAQVLRLSCIYALLDCSATIRRVHLEAALSLWQFCEDSAQFIFGVDLLTPDAKKLLGWLRDAGGSGMNKTEIYGKFGRRIKSHDLDALLVELTIDMAADSQEIATAGRTEERWYAAEYAPRTDESDEESSESGEPNSSNSSTSAIAA